MPKCARLAQQIAAERDAEIARVIAAAEKRCLLLAGCARRGHRPARRGGGGASPVGRGAGAAPMIVPMARVRIMGPRGRLPEVLGMVQDLGVLHLASAPSGGPLHGNALTSGEARRRRQLWRILEDVDAVLTECPTSSEAGAPGAPECPRWARLARRTRRIARTARRACRAAGGGAGAAAALPGFLRGLRDAASDTTTPARLYRLSRRASRRSG